MQRLFGFLATLPEGKVADPTELSSVLADHWEDFSGYCAERMDGDKLYRRMENAVWKPPKLTFQIERHGAFCLGSTRAELHAWEVDVEKRTATCNSGRYRQIVPREPRLDVKPLAAEAVDLILNAKEDPRVQWNDDGSVKVRIGMFIPAGSTYQQTLIGRRRRFRNEVEKRLTPFGWTTVKPNVYRPAEEPSDSHSVQSEEIQTPASASDR